MSLPFKVFYHDRQDHIAAEWPCVAAFAREGDARMFALSLSNAPGAGAVRVRGKRDKLVWERTIAL